MIRDVAEDVAKVTFGVEAVELGRADERVERGGAFSACVRISSCHCPTKNCKTPNWHLSDSERFIHENALLKLPWMAVVLSPPRDLDNLFESNDTWRGVS